MFGSVRDLRASSKDAGRSDNAEGTLAEDTFRLMGCVTVKCTDGLVELEWLRNSLADFIVDAATVVLMTLGGSPATAKGRQPHFSQSSGGYSDPTLTLLRHIPGDRPSPCVPGSFSGTPENSHVSRG